MPPVKKEDGTSIPGYEDRYVAFVDILGFSSIVERSKSVPDQVKRLHNALLRLSAKVAEGRIGAIPMDATNFSDSVVLSTSISSEGLLRVLDVINGFSVDMLANNMLLRGAIVRGLLLHSTEVTFGPALIDSYRLESTISFHPRIMIAGSVLDDIALYSQAPELRHQFSRFVVSGLHDVAYLNPFSTWHDRTVFSKEDIGHLIDLQAIIASGLIETPNAPSICEKYKWLARKLNAFISGRELQEKIALIEID